MGYRDHMHVVLIPGLWLDASSWHAVSPLLREAGHQPHPLTLPGLGAPADTSAGLGIDDWADAVVATIDELDEPVVVVGHSGGGNVAWAAADRRPDAVSRVILVDTLPPAPGGIIWEFPVVDGVVPFPGWDAFEEAEIRDLPVPLRETIAASAGSVPARIPTDPLQLGDPARHLVPTTILMGTASADDISALLEDPPSWAAELALIQNLTIVEIDSGHWPQFSTPEALAARIVEAIAQG